MKKPLTIQQYYDIDMKAEIRALVVGNEVFPWGIEDDSLEQAANYCKTDPSLATAFHGSIQQHFLKCFSAFLGRPVTLPELLSCIEKGEIDAPSKILLA